MNPYMSVPIKTPGKFRVGHQSEGRLDHKAALERTHGRAAAGTQAAKRSLEHAECRPEKEMAGAVSQLREHVDRRSVHPAQPHDRMGCPEQPATCAGSSELRRGQAHFARRAQGQMGAVPGLERGRKAQACRKRPTQAARGSHSRAAGFVPEARAGAGRHACRAAHAQNPAGTVARSRARNDPGGLAAGARPRGNDAGGFRHACCTHASQRRAGSGGSPGTGTVFCGRGTPLCPLTPRLRWFPALPRRRAPIRLPRRFLQRPALLFR